MFPLISALSCQTALIRRHVKLATMKSVEKSNWNKSIAKNKYDKH